MIPLWVTLFRVAMGILMTGRWHNISAGFVATEQLAFAQRLGEVRGAAATLKAGR